jgi:tripartite-type tricarboxylate transporter receptor subunit TctC
MVAPKHTSAAIIERLHLIVTSVLKSKETQERLSKIGYEPEGSTPTQLNEHIKLELTRYGKLIKAIGFKDES